MKWYQWLGLIPKQWMDQSDEGWAKAMETARANQKLAEAQYQSAKDQIDRDTVIIKARNEEIAKFRDEQAEIFKTTERITERSVQDHLKQKEEIDRLKSDLKSAEDRYHDLVKQLIAPKLAPPAPAKVVPGDTQAEDQYREEERAVYTDVASAGFRKNMIQGLMKDKGLTEAEAIEDTDEILRDLNGDMSHALTDDERANLNV